VTAGRASRANSLNSAGSGGVVDSGVTAVLVSRASRGLRRELRPLVWMVLEEVALDAVVADGRLIARTSARRLAEGLGIDPGSAASALRSLRERGVLALERESGVSGRFGLAVYVLHRVDGLAVVTLAGGAPGVEEPHVVQPHMTMSDTVSQVAPAVGATNVVGAGATPGGQAMPRGARREAVGQGALDLGLGSG
jgi:DNA-binding transcriptional ArsR family regulator